VAITRTATSSLLASGEDNHRGFLATASSKYDGLDISTQINITVNGGRLKFVMRMISIGLGVVYNGQRQVWGQMLLVPKDPCQCWNIKFKLL
jgi:hypothetical protein